MTINKYILQYGSLAGWPYTLAEGLNRVGLSSINVINENSDYADLDRQLSSHRFLYQEDEAKLMKLYKRFKFLREVGNNCALVHYHGGVITRAAWHHLYEGAFLELRGIPMLMSFGGGDARIVEMARKRNPFFYREVDRDHDKKIRTYLRTISKHIRYVATDCEMAEYVAPYFEKVFTFRQPVNVSDFEFTPPLKRPPVFLHVPTHPMAKGTDYIISAAEKLKLEGFRFELRIIQQLTQKQLFQEIVKCDIYIDELRCGSHGMTSVETMAAGKPTITYIREDLIEKFPSELPLIIANPETIYTVMKQLLRDHDMVMDISIRSRRYVEKYHDAETVAMEMLKVYSEIGLGKQMKITLDCD